MTSAVEVQSARKEYGSGDKLVRALVGALYGQRSGRIGGTGEDARVSPEVTGPVRTACVGARS